MKATTSTLLQVSLFILTVTGFASFTLADVRLPSVISDHMVVQRDMPIRIWGWADAGEEVTVTLGTDSASVKANTDGKWTLDLKPQKAGGPHKLTVKGKNEIVVNDVLVGEVWVCSGQSNMAWTVSRSNDPQKEIAAANFPKIRMVTLARKMADNPQDDCTGKWQITTSKTAGGFSAAAYFFGRELHNELKVPIGLINTSWGGSTCEAWTSREKIAADKELASLPKRDVGNKHHHRASKIYNGMIAPLLPYRVRGAIWYQGESNVTRSGQYAKLFPAMIVDWRERWNTGDLPFGFVQLAPFHYNGKGPRAAAALREAQMAALKLPNTGMATTLDVGNVRDIHPKNKQAVGKRLALWALAKSYGKNVTHSGPTYLSHKTEGNKVRITLNNLGSGLKSRDGKPLSCFEVAGSDKNFVPATADIDGGQVVVSSNKVTKPVAVRFAWTNVSEPNLQNKEGLPAVQFRTDNWLIAETTVVAAAPSKQPPRKRPRPSQPKDDPKLPRVLIIGDSISMGYTVPVRNLMKGKANVHRPNANCGPTTRGLANIDQWLGKGKWDVIHFNWGLHDLKYMDANGKLVAVDKGKQQVPIEQYEENLRKLVKRLKKTSATLIWCSTTPVPKGAAGRVPGDSARYNVVAKKVMDDEGVAIHDLFTFASSKLDKIQQPKNVHFSKQGSQALAQQVAKAIEGKLKK